MPAKRRTQTLAKAQLSRGRLAALELGRALLAERRDAFAEVVRRAEQAVGEPFYLEAQTEQTVVRMVEHTLGEPKIFSTVLRCSLSRCLLKAGTSVEGPGLLPGVRFRLDRPGLCSERSFSQIDCSNRCGGEPLSPSWSSSALAKGSSGVHYSSDLGKTWKRSRRLMLPDDFGVDRERDVAVHCYGGQIMTALGSDEWQPQKDGRGPKYQ